MALPLFQDVNARLAQNNRQLPFRFYNNMPLPTSSALVRDFIDNQRMLNYFTILYFRDFIDNQRMLN